MRVLILTTLASIGLLLSAGCLERKETITVHRDGKVDFVSEFEGDPGDFTGGDPLPVEEHGWSVQDTVKKEDDKEKKRRMAKLTVAAGKPLPDAYVPPEDPLHDTALQFPTTVRVEKRGDGTYYHFKRVYKGREQARYAVHQKAFQENEEVKAVTGKNPEELTADERRLLVSALRDAEAGKRAEFLLAGYEAMKERWPQHYYLIARETLLNSFQHVDLEPLVTLLGEPESAQRNVKIDDYSREWLAKADETVTQELRSLGAKEAEIGAFYAAVSKEEERRAVTEDLGDETWNVSVRLPGDLIAHNAGKIEEGAPVWEFKGDGLHDRDQMLMATSRVAR